MSSYALTYVALISVGEDLGLGGGEGMWTRMMVAGFPGRAVKDCADVSGVLPGVLGVPLGSAGSQISRKSSRVAPRPFASHIPLADAVYYTILYYTILYYTIL